MEKITHKIEVIFNHYGVKGIHKTTVYDNIERIVLVDGEEIYRDKQRNGIYHKDKSILRQFENWSNEFLLKEFDNRKDVDSKNHDCSCFCCKFWLKLFRKCFKFKS